MTIQQPEDAQGEVGDALKAHFNRSADFLTVDQICDMTGLGREAVIAALRVFHKSGWAEGPIVAEYDYPSVITGITYH